MNAEWYVGCGVQLRGHGLIVGTTPAFPVVAEEVVKNLSDDNRSSRWELMRSRSATYSIVTLCYSYSFVSFHIYV
jgi:hypothetical protein